MVMTNTESPVLVVKKHLFDATFELNVVACAESTTTSSKGVATKFFWMKEVCESGENRKIICMRCLTRRRECTVEDDTELDKILKTINPDEFELVNL